MFKVITLIFLICLAGKRLHSQTFGEWFSQKKTQKKYLIEQIAALKVYSEFLKKGYDIGKKGLGTISKIKDGEFNLHRDFFGNLSIVNPAIKHDPRVKKIAELQLSILEIREQVIRNLESSDLVVVSEKLYCKKVFERLTEDCTHILDELKTIALTDEFSMKDDERLSRIENLHKQMIDNYRFANHFKNQIVTLIVSRKQEQWDVAKSKSLFDIK